VIQKADFATYAAVCETNNSGARQRGMLSSDAYEAALADPRTIFCTFGGHCLPVFIDLRYGMAMGYDSTKCLRLNTSDIAELLLMCLPVQELDDAARCEVAKAMSIRGQCALFFCDHNGDEAVALAGILHSEMISYEEVPMEDPRAHEPDRQASMQLFGCSFINGRTNTTRAACTLQDLQRYGASDTEKVEAGKVAVRLLRGSQLTDIEADEFWCVYNQRFDYLGEYHPISMQDSRTEFYSLVRSPNTLISAAFSLNSSGSEGLTCFAFFVDEIGARAYWLNRDYLDMAFSSLLTGDRAAIRVFTPGLVSVGLNRSYAALCIGKFARAAVSSGADFSILYETTNLSKRYVPAIVDRCTGAHTSDGIVSSSRMLDESIYRLWLVSPTA
jgi:hypothetical protein